MRELWWIVYFCFFPLAYLGSSGIFGKEAKEVANEFFNWVGRIFVLIGIMMMLAYFGPILIAIVQTFVASLLGQSS